MRMTAKRWEIIDEEFISYTGGTAQLISNGECEIHLWETPKDAQLFCDKLNAINEENEQLKFENNELKRALALDEVEYIIADGKKIDIPPYYEFEQRYDSVMHRREYDGYD